MKPDFKPQKSLTPDLDSLKSGLKPLEYFKFLKSLKSGLKSFKSLKSDLKSWNPGHKPQKEQLIPRIGSL